jgi:hypothetical protein
MASTPEDPVRIEKDGHTYDHLDADVWAVDRDSDDPKVTYSDKIVTDLGIPPEDVPGTPEHEGKRRDDAAANS